MPLLNAVVSFLLTSSLNSSIVCFKASLVFLLVTKSFKLLILSSSSLIPYLVLKLGSLGQSLTECPMPLHHCHFNLFLNLSSLSFISSKSSSSSCLLSCFLNTQPLASLLVCPQHHHIFPPHSALCVVQLQLKLSVSKYSFWQLFTYFLVYVDVTTTLHFNQSLTKFFHFVFQVICMLFGGLIARLCSLSGRLWCL